MIGRGKVGAVASKVTVEELAIRGLVAFSITRSYFTEPSKRTLTLAKRWHKTRTLHSFALVDVPKGHAAIVASTHYDPRVDRVGIQHVHRVGVPAQRVHQGACLGVPYLSPDKSSE